MTCVENESWHIWSRWSLDPLDIFRPKSRHVGLQLFSNCPVHTASDWLSIASTSFGWSDVTQFYQIWIGHEKWIYCKIHSRSFWQKLQQPFPHNGSLVLSCLLPAFTVFLKHAVYLWSLLMLKMEVMYRNCRGTFHSKAVYTKLDCRVTLQNASLNRILFDKPGKTARNTSRRFNSQAEGNGRDMFAGKALDQDAVIARYGEGFSVLSGAELQW